MSRPVRVIILLPLLYPCWLAMLAAHEAGHVLHARLSGGTVAHVHLPPLGFSRTDLSHNPRPAFVAWGGPAWGCLIPLLAWATTAALTARRPPNHPLALPRRAAMFFAGFCLIANGAYVGAGWTMRAGDAADLLRHGTPPWVMVAFGLAATAAGLYLWHRLGARPPAGATPAHPDQ